MKLWFSWKKNSKKEEVQKLHDSVTPEVIENAFNKRKEEIESLRKYDRGEKQIIAPDLGTMV